MLLSQLVVFRDLLPLNQTFWAGWVGTYRMLVVAECPRHVSLVRSKTQVVARVIHEALHGVDPPAREQKRDPLLIRPIPTVDNVFIARTRVLCD